MNIEVTWRLVAYLCAANLQTSKPGQKILDTTWRSAFESRKLLRNVLDLIPYTHRARESRFPLPSWLPIFKLRLPQWDSYVRLVHYRWWRPSRQKQAVNTDGWCGAPKASYPPIWEKPPTAKNRIRLLRIWYQSLISNIPVLRWKKCNIPIASTNPSHLRFSWFYR